MDEILQELINLPKQQADKLSDLIGKYAHAEWKRGWHTGWNRAMDTAGYGTPPEPSVRNEVRNNLNNVGV